MGNLEVFQQILSVFLFCYSRLFHNTHAHSIWQMITKQITYFPEAGSDLRLLFWRGASIPYLRFLSNSQNHVRAIIITLKDLHNYRPTNKWFDNHNHDVCARREALRTRLKRRRHSHVRARAWGEQFYTWDSLPSATSTRSVSPADSPAALRRKLLQLRQTQNESHPVLPLLPRPALLTH